MSSQVNGVTPLNQIRLTNVAFVRLKKNNQIYEVAAYRNKVVNWRNRIETDLNEVLQVQDVFTNVARGLAASNNDLLRGFDTTDKEAICKEILEKGDFQVSELERKTLLEGMFRDVASIVVEKSYNTDTGRPYSMSMLQNAMKDIHYSVSLSKSAKQQALDVIRRLKKVMPIARTKLSLRITTPSANASALEAMLVENAAEIMKKSASAGSGTVETPDESTVDTTLTVIEVNIHPENFRAIEDLTTSLTHGRGILEIIHQQHALSQSGMKEDEDENAEEEDRIRIVAQTTECQKEKGKDKGKGKRGGQREKEGEMTGKDKDRNEDEVVFFMAKSGKSNKKKKEKKKLAKQQRLEEERGDLEDRGDSDGDSDRDDGENSVIPAALLQLEDSRKGGGRGGRGEDRVAPKEAKKSKKNKRLEKEKKKAFDSSELERSERLEALESERLAKKTLTEDDSTTSRSALQTGAFKCNTCSACFTESVDHRAHFKSDWHRINLKRKLLKLPLVSSEEEFYSVHVDHWDCNIDEHA